MPCTFPHVKHRTGMIISVSLAGPVESVLKFCKSPKQQAWCLLCSEVQPSRFSEGSELLSHVLDLEAGLTDDFYQLRFTRQTSSPPFKSFEAGCKVACRPEPDQATYEVECMLSKRSTSYPSAVHFVYLMVSSDRRQK